MLLCCLHLHGYQDASGCMEHTRITGPSCPNSPARPVCGDRARRLFQSGLRADDAEDLPTDAHEAVRWDEPGRGTKGRGSWPVLYPCGIGLVWRSWSTAESQFGSVPVMTVTMFKNGGERTTQ